MRKAELKQLFCVRRFQQVAEILEISPSALTQWEDPLPRHAIITVLGIAALKRFTVGRELMKQIRRDYGPRRRKSDAGADETEYFDEDE